MTLEEWGPAAVYAVDAYEKWGGAENGQQSEDQGETGIGMALGDPGGRGRTIFGYLGEKDATGRDGKREERTRVFGSAIGNFSKGDSHRVEYLVKGYDWKALGKGKGKVVDVCASSLSPSVFSLSLFAVSLSFSPSFSPRSFPPAVLFFLCKVRPPATLLEQYGLIANIRLLFAGSRLAAPTDTSAWQSPTSHHT